MPYNFAAESFYTMKLCSRLCVGVVALLVERQICDQEVVGSSLGRARGVKTLGKFFTPICVSVRQAVSWYRPKGGDALRLGSKGRYMVHVWVAGKTV